MNEEVLKKFEQWKILVDDEVLLEEISKVEHEKEEIIDRFSTDLEFGTGGLRGVLGVGTNRMNIYVVRRATQGLSNYLNSKFNNSSVAIAYDSRINSLLFAKEACRVLSANGINCYIYEELMPTPSLSYAVRKLSCKAGICITASHNPAKYNGYKVYGKDGCQITLTDAKEILNEINKLDYFNDIKIDSFENNEKINYISKNLIEDYISDLVNISPKQKIDNLKIVYTPLNGAGKKCVISGLNNLGLKEINVVEEQSMPDGNFPTCPYPNPEKAEALSLGIRDAKKIGADLVLATDPDSDRVGVAVKHKDNYVLINGNEMGILLFNYICEKKIFNRDMPINPVVIKTIVTTDMTFEIAKEYEVNVIEVLTGFKFIGEQIGILEKENRLNDYLFGFEESYGYLSSTFVRDKDAVNASMLICSMTSDYKEENKTLIDKLNELFEQYGFYKNKLLDYTFEGIEGKEKINNIMNNLRGKYRKMFADIDVKDYIDYNESSVNGLPKSNVLRFNLMDGSKIVVRPSGTEPKIKFYLESVSNTSEESLNKIEYFKKFIEKEVV